MLGREAYRGSLSLGRQISVAEGLEDGRGRRERERESRKRSEERNRKRGWRKEGGKESVEKRV